MAASSRPRIRSRLPLSPLIGAVLAAVLAACAGSTATSSPPSGTGSIGPVATATPVPPSPTTAPAFPVTLTDDEGGTTSLKAAPTKIVSLTPAATETLFAIGAGPRVVATTDFDDYPPEATKLQHVASYTSVDVEKIVGLGVDLVIAGGNAFNPPEAIAKLRSLGVPVLVIYAKTISGALADIRLVGRASGNAAQAEALTRSMEADFNAVSAAAATSSAKPKVFYEIDATTKIYTAADESFLAQMLRLAGGDPITTGSTTSFELPLEKLVAANPDLILLGDAAYGATPDQVKKRPGWSGIKAVVAGRIVPVNDIVVTRPGPRLTQGLRALVAAIHPEVVLPSPEPIASGEPLASEAPASQPASSPTASAP